MGFNSRKNKRLKKVRQEKGSDEMFNYFWNLSERYGGQLKARQMAIGFGGEEHEFWEVYFQEDGEVIANITNQEEYLEFKKYTDLKWSETNGGEEWI